MSFLPPGLPTLNISSFLRHRRTSGGPEVQNTTEDDNSYRKDTTVIVQSDNAQNSTALTEQINKKLSHFLWRRLVHSTSGPLNIDHGWSAVAAFSELESSRLTKQQRAIKQAEV